MSNEVIATMVRAEQVGHPHEATYRVPAGSEVYCVFEGVPDDCPAFGCFSPISMLACRSLAEFTDTVPGPGYAAVYGAAGLIKLGSLPTYPISAAVGSVALCGHGGPGGAFFCTKPAGHSAGHEARERATGRVILAWRAIEQDAPLTAAFPSGWIEKPFAVADDPDRATCHDCGYTWKKGADGSHSCAGVLQRHLEQVRAAVRALEDSGVAADAARYRWLRDAKGCYFPEEAHVHLTGGPEKLDAAIDAEMAEDAKAAARKEEDDRMRRDFETWWDARGFKDQAEPQKAELAAWAAWVASSVTTRKAAP